MRTYKYVLLWRMHSATLCLSRWSPRSPMIAVNTGYSGFPPAITILR